MNVRGVIKPRKGSPVTTVEASVATAPGVTDLGASQVTAFIQAHDTYSKSVLATLSLSTKEARELGARLIKTADDADYSAELEATRTTRRS